MHVGPDGTAFARWGYLGGVSAIQLVHRLSGTPAGGQVIAGSRYQVGSQSGASSVLIGHGHSSGKSSRPVSAITATSASDQTPLTNSWSASNTRRLGASLKQPSAIDRRSAISRVHAMH